MISFVPARNYLFKVSNFNTRIKCESCSILRMYSSVFLVSLLLNCEHILNFVLIVDFEQANVRLVHIEKSNTYEDKIGHFMRYVVVFLSVNKIFQ